MGKILSGIRFRFKNKGALLILVFISCLFIFEHECAFSQVNSTADQEIVFEEISPVLVRQDASAGEAPPLLPSNVITVEPLENKGTWPVIERREQHPLAHLSRGTNEINDLFNSRIKSAFGQLRPKFDSLPDFKANPLLNGASNFQMLLRQTLDKIPDAKISEWQKLMASIKLDRILKDASVETAQLLRIDLDKLSAIHTTGSDISLCHGIQVFCRAANTTGWVDSSPSVRQMAVTLHSGNPTEPVGDALFVKKGDATIGFINVGLSRFTMTSLASSISVITTTRDALLDRNLDDVADLTQGTVAGPGAATPGVSTASTTFATDEDCPNPVQLQTLDVLVAYTRKAEATALADGQDLTMLATMAQEMSNLSFRKSNINGKVNVSGTMLTDFSESGDFGKDIGELVKPDGLLKKVHEERKRIKAGIVVLIVEHPDPKNCGKAAAIGVAKQNAMVAVNWRCLMHRFSFIHEIGHLAGAWHDPKTVGTGFVIDPPYASGYVTPGDHPIATIMAYTTACAKPCGRSFYWANPFIKTPAGAPLGTVGRNFDACVWRKRLEAMSKFDGG